MNKVTQKLNEQFVEREALFELEQAFEEPPSSLAGRAAFVEAIAARIEKQRRNDY